MATFDDLAPCDIRVPVLDEQALERARRTVASYAVDAADCADLLAMLGISPAGDGALCAECAQPMSRLPGLGYQAGRGGGGQCRSCVEKAERAAAAVCLYGHRLAGVGDQCAICRELVPLDDLRMVIERIRRDTGMGVNAIAARARISKSSLTSALVPSRAQRRISRRTYEAVRRLAEELSA